MVTYMQSFNARLQAKVSGWLASPHFIWIILGLLIVQSLWIALTARYPQAFDENFHFGLIRLHAEQWLPFFTSQPAGADVYGPAWRDGSYFYHYLMSWPYRLIASLSGSEAGQVIFLRLINIGIFASGILVYRRLFDALGLSRRLAHAALLFFVLLPIVPLLAGQINYDNLIFLLTGLLFLHTVRYIQALRQRNSLDITAVLLIVIWGLLAAVCKYTSLPVFAAIAGLLAIETFMARRSTGSWPVAAWPRRGLLIAGLFVVLLCAGLSLERYGVNLLRYHSLQPDCAKVLTVERCESYSPWARDHLFAEIYDRPGAWGIIIYPFVWVYRMIYETMFTIGSFFGPDGTVTYQAASPLLVANITAWVITLGGVALCVVFWKRLWRQPAIRLLLLACAFYAFVLLAKNVSMYLHTGEAVAIHGRYLIPMYPFLLVLLAMGFNWGANMLRHSYLKTWLIVITVFLFLQGGGIMAWIVRGNTTWVWQQSEPAQNLNANTRDVLNRITVR